MSALLALLLLAAQSPQAPQEPAPDPAQDAPAAKPLPQVGDFAEGMRRMRELYEAKQYADARAIGDALLAPNRVQRARSEWEESYPWTRGVFAFCEPLLDMAGAGGLPAPARGEVRYAQGFVAAESGDLQAAEADFDTALALAGPGSLRLDAGYDRGAVALAAAEKVRLETTGAQGRPAAERAGDPLAALEQMYLHAKDLLVQRLLADWRDADTRANLELIQLRLREIAERKKEQEAQKEQQKQQQKQDQQDAKDSKDDGGDPQQKQDQQQSDPKQGDQQQGDPKDAEQKPAEPKDAKSDKEQKDAQSESKQEAGKDGSPASQGEQREARVLTREEMMRLLDQLEEIEKQGRTLQARLKDARRKKTDKDW